MDPKRSTRAIIWFVLAMFAIWGGLAFLLTLKQNNPNTSAPVNQVSTDRFVLTHRVYNDTHTYEGELEVPSPCHTLSSGVQFEDGMTPRAMIEISVLPPAEGQICAQVVSKESFTVSLSSHAIPEISLFVNGKDTPVTVTEGQ